MRTPPAALALLLLVGCSDDSGGSADAALPDLASADAAPDQAAADTTVPDQAPGPDGPSPTILALGNHTGWGEKECGKAGCHTLPVTDHTETSPPQCASCHGANGACDANGAYSTRKSHTKTDSCLSCHAGMGHGYTQNADCAACHLAAAGTQDCQGP